MANGALLLTLGGHTDKVISVGVSPDGVTIVSGSADNTVRLWRAADGALLRTLEGHTDWMASVAVSPDGVAIEAPALGTERCGCGAWPTARCCARLRGTAGV